MTSKGLINGSLVIAGGGRLHSDVIVIPLMGSSILELTILIPPNPKNKDNQMMPNNEKRATISTKRINILTTLPLILTLIRKKSDPTEVMRPSKVPFVVIILTRVFVFINLTA